MKEIIWTEQFSVGVEMFDEHHKEIISMFNKLASEKNATTDSEIISDTLTKMTKYAGYHFKKEEELMVKYGYPDYLRHKELHVSYIKKTVAFCSDTMKKVDVIPDKILFYLREWWGKHILDEDMKYKEFFQKMDVR